MWRLQPTQRKVAPGPAKKLKLQKGLQMIEGVWGTGCLIIAANGIGFNSPCHFLNPLKAGPWLIPSCSARRLTVKRRREQTKHAAWRLWTKS